MRARGGRGARVPDAGRAAGRGLARGRHRGEEAAPPAHAAPRLPRVGPRAEDVGLVPGAARGPRGAARGAGLGRAVVHGVAGPVQGVAVGPDLARERRLRERDRVAAAELLRVDDFDLRVVVFQTTKPSTRVSTVAFAGAPANVAVQPQAPS